MTKTYFTSIKTFKIFVFLFIASIINTHAQQDTSLLDKSETLDVVTWNLQWFGAPQKSYNASTFNQQLVSVSSTIISLDADIYALQEVVNDPVNGYYLEKLVDQLNEDTYSNKYIGYVSDRYSLYFNTPTTDYPSQCIAFIINTETVAVVDQYPMFKDLYNGYSTSYIEGYDGNPATFWSSGRLPYLLQGIVSVNGSNEVIDFINIHAKCCDGSEDRREYDADYLLNAVNSEFELDNVVVLGDYNDDTSAGSPYDNWYTNSNLYYKEVAGEGIDHISVSNELYDEDEVLNNNEYIETVSISDHDPVMVRLKLETTKTNQIITLESIGDQTIGSAVDLVTTTNSGLSIEYKVLYGDVEINNNQATFSATGNYAIQAIQTGNEIYSPAFSNIISGTVTKNQQTIDFDPIEDKTMGDDSFELIATASSGLDVSYEVTEGNVTITNNVVTLVEAGNVTIRAYQSGSDLYDSAEAFQSFIVEDKSGIEDEYAKQVKVYPNPCNNKIEIEMPDSSIKQIDIYNITGVKVKSLFAYDIAKINVSDLLNGLYFIQITSGKITITKKIEIIH